MIFNLRHKKKKKIRGYKTIDIFIKRIEDRTNDDDDDDDDHNNNNNNNKTKSKILNRRTHSKRGNNKKNIPLFC